MRLTSTKYHNSNSVYTTNCTVLVILIYKFKMRVRAINIEVLAKMRYNLLKPMAILGPFCGLFVSEEQSSVTFVLAATLLIINMITSYLYLYFHLGDIIEVSRCLTTSNTYTSAFTCLALCAIKKEAYIRVLKEVNHEFEAEFENASESAKRGLLAINRSLVVIVVTILIGIICFVMDPLVSETKKLVTPAWYPFDTDNTIGFAIVFIIQMFGGSISGVLITLTGTYFTNVMEQTCLHFDNLSNSLSMRLQLKGKNYEHSIDKNAEKSFHEFLAKFIERHNQLLSRRIKAVDGIFSSFFLIYCIILVPIISAAALEFVSFNRAEATPYFMKHACIVTIGLVLLYGPCKCGSKIVTAQTDVSRALFMEERMVFSESIQRSLNIINSRAQVPNIITTGGFVSFDMVAYGQALGLFYSIFAILHHFKTAEKMQEK